MGNYIQYWELDRSPYRRAKAVYPSPALEEATARIEFLVEQGPQVAALLGEAGSGKSIVLSVIADRQRRQGSCVAMTDALGTTPRELASSLVVALGGTTQLTDDSPRLWRRLGDTLSQQLWQSSAAVLLVDNAGAASVDFLQAVQRIMHLANATKSRLTLVLASAERPASRWPGELRRLVDLRIDMYAWDSLTTVDYLQHAAIDAGRCTPLFTEDALYRLHELSAGVPRQVARLAEMALIAGAAAQVPLIDSGCVTSVHDELACAI